MLQPNPAIRGVKGVQYETLSSLLKHFRQTVEKEAGPLQNVDLNGVLFLADLCTFLGFSDPLRDEVLGKSAAAWLHSVLTEPVKPTVKH